MNNSFDCTWNLLTSKCSDHDLINKNNETIIKNSLINQCPRYNVSINELFVADGNEFILGDKNQVFIETIGLKSQIQKYFRCVLTLMNRSIITRQGRIQNNSLICAPFQVRRK